MKQIESGPNGAVWGVNRRNQIFYRAGVTRRNPIGRRWLHIRGRLSYISVGCAGVYGVNKRHQIWRYRGKCWNIHGFGRGLGSDKVRTLFLSLCLLM